MERPFWKDKISLAAFVGTVAVGVAGYYSLLRWEPPSLDENLVSVSTLIVRPSLDVSALCEPPGKYGEKVLPSHIRFIVKAEDVNTGPSKMWIVIKNQQTVIEMVTTYMTNKGLINIEGTYEGFLGSIDNAKQHLIKTVNPYSVQIRGEIIANGLPATEKIIAEKSILTPSCPK